MAREESDREDLLREATALVERVELQLTGEAAALPQPVVAGFRADGCASFYFGADPAYHFNTDRQLRRAYCRGQLFKANDGTLVAMRRVRTEGQVQLQSRVLNTDQQEDFCRDLLTHCDQLLATLRDGNYQIEGQVPNEGSVVKRVKEWLTRLDTVQIAPVPNAR